MCCYFHRDRRLIIFHVVFPLGPAGIFSRRWIIVVRLVIIDHLQLRQTLTVTFVARRQGHHKRELIPLETTQQSLSDAIQYKRIERYGRAWLSTHTHTYTWSRVRNSIKCRCKLPTQIASAKASIQSLKKWNYLFCFCSFSVSRSFPSFFFVILFLFTFL